MECVVHNGAPAAGACVGCGSFFCGSCLTEIKRKKYCSPCTSDLLEAKDREVERERARADSGRHQNIVVNATGGSSSAAASAGGGHHHHSRHQEPGASKILCAVLALLFPIGLHRFLMGHVGTGIVQMCLALFLGIGIFWSWIDGILILTGSLRMADGRPLS